MPQTYFAPAKVAKSRFEEKVVDNGVLVLTRHSLTIHKNKPAILAGFDVDHTLAVTKSGNVFARGGSDWKLLPHAHSLKERMEALKSRFPEHQCLCVLFTNQGGTLPKKISKSYTNLKQKLTGIAESLDCVDIVFAALKAEDRIKHKYRKPAIGMLGLVQDLVPEISFQESFYVGDAAGRREDHSSDDKNFAKDAKLRFYTPENYFDSTRDAIERKRSPPAINLEEATENRKVTVDSKASIKSLTSLGETDNDQSSSATAYHEDLKQMPRSGSLKRLSAPKEYSKKAKTAP